jgi:hypothetical protein
VPCDAINPGSRIMFGFRFCYVILILSSVCGLRSPRGTLCATADCVRVTLKHTCA